MSASKVVGDYYSECRLRNQNSRFLYIFRWFREKGWDAESEKLFDNPREILSYFKEKVGVRVLVMQKETEQGLIYWQGVFKLKKKCRPIQFTNGLGFKFKKVIVKSVREGDTDLSEGISYCQRPEKRVPGTGVYQINEE